MGLTRLKMESTSGGEKSWEEQTVKKSKKGVEGVPVIKWTRWGLVMGDLGPHHGRRPFCKSGIEKGFGQ